MDNPFSYSKALLVAIMIVSLMGVAAQENGVTISNNITQKNKLMNNLSLNLSIINETILDADNSEKVDPNDNVSFIISSDLKTKSNDGFRINTSIGNSEIQPRKRSAFVINMFSIPTRNANYTDEYLLSAAYLSRKVEGTPHGHVTYYN